VIPGSDGAGVVINTGTKVTAIAPGDRVVTHLVPSEFPAHTELYPLAETTLPHMGHICAGLGQELDGTLTTRGVFKESCLARLGRELSFEQAATLSCSGITAWNALMGLRGREVRKDDWVLIQGTGGVSIAAMQVSTNSVSKDDV
jgi:NADPH:quinone reductase-like Zn-dependent oxidoreductase